MDKEFVEVLQYAASLRSATLMNRSFSQIGITSVVHQGKLISGEYLA